MLIDSHCHFFTKNILAKISNIERATIHADKLVKRMGTHDRKTMNPSLSLGLNAVDFLLTGLNNTALQMYEHMKESYGQDFIAIPLMLDLTYASISPKDEIHKKPNLTHTLLTKTNEKFEKRKTIANLATAIEEKYDIYERSAFRNDLFKNSYQIQIEELTQVKNQLPDRVYPFFSIDPRRDSEFDDGVLGEIKKYIGKDKPFLGLKLYTSLGYSPTHPVLFDDSQGECVYSYCQKNKIPITIHSSLEGFSHMMDTNHIVGDIYYPPAGKPVPAQDVYENGLVEYKKSIKSMYYREAAQERLITLNHPVLWRKVLEKYPKLIMDMAHFGGVIQAYEYAQGKKTAFWPEYVKEIMLDFPKVYTDLSCYYDYNNDTKYLKNFYENVYVKLPSSVKKRVMYGSDYYMLTMFNTNLKDYIATFRDAFGEDFTKISEINPRRFLNL